MQNVPGHPQLRTGLSYVPVSVGVGFGSTVATKMFGYGEATDIWLLRLVVQFAEAGAAWSLATRDGQLSEALLLALEYVPVGRLLGVRPDCLADCALA
jgi:hypothetical protein